MHTIGVLGSAVVGQTLAQGFKKHGYAVRIGTREPAKLAEVSQTYGIEAGNFAQGAACGGPNGGPARRGRAGAPTRGDPHR